MTFRYDLDRPTVEAVVEVLARMYPDQILPVNDEWWEYYSAPLSAPKVYPVVGPVGAVA